RLAQPFLSDHPRTDVMALGHPPTVPANEAERPPLFCSRPKLATPRPASQHHSLRCVLYHWSVYPNWFDRCLFSPILLIRVIRVHCIFVHLIPFHIRSMHSHS